MLYNFLFVSNTTIDLVQFNSIVFFILCFGIVNQIVSNNQRARKELKIIQNLSIVVEPKVVVCIQP